MYALSKGVQPLKLNESIYRVYGSMKYQKQSNLTKYLCIEEFLYPHISNFSYFAPPTPTLFSLKSAQLTDALP